MEPAASSCCSPTPSSRTRVADGRTPFEVFRQRRFLKQRPCRTWLEAHADLADSVLHIGIDWSEERRAPWTVSFPMRDPPHVTKEPMLDAARAAGLEPPRLYAWGFAHNGCGSMCVRGGHKPWTHVLDVFPERYAQAERGEQELRADLGDVATQHDRTGGHSRPLTLTDFRERQESQKGQTRRRNHDH